MKKTTQIVLISGFTMLLTIAGQSLFAADMMQDGMNSNTKKMTDKPMTGDPMMAKTEPPMATEMKGSSHKENEKKMSGNTMTDMPMEDTKTMKKGMN